jgi:hypothetical protein
MGMMMILVVDMHGDLILLPFLYMCYLLSAFLWRCETDLHLRGSGKTESVHWTWLGWVVL